MFFIRVRCSFEKVKLCSAGRARLRSCLCIAGLLPATGPCSNLIRPRVVSKGAGPNNRNRNDRESGSLGSCAFEYALEASTHDDAASVRLSSFKCNPASCSNTCPAFSPAQQSSTPIRGPNTSWGERALASPGILCFMIAIARPSCRKRLHDCPRHDTVRGALVMLQGGSWILKTDPMHRPTETIYGSHGPRHMKGRKYASSHS
jgi:hypothetical protein